MKHYSHYASQKDNKKYFDELIFCDKCAVRAKWLRAKLLQFFFLPFFMRYKEYAT